LLDKIVEAAPQVRTRIEEDLNPTLVAEREALRRRVDEIQGELHRARGEDADRIAGLEREKSAVESRVAHATAQLNQTKLILGRAALRDASWLDYIRRTMMPKQPGRAPFHNAREVAIRGYHAGPARDPALSDVTWSKVPYKENGLHRGYHAAIIFKGSNFDPGVMWTMRQIGETKPSAPHSDWFWRLPNIYWGDYLEVSCSEDEIESPLSWRGYEFQVRNPGAREPSAWIPFTYPYDLPLLIRVRDEALDAGLALLDAGNAAQAVEPLRKAMVFTQHLRDVAPSPSVDPGELHEKALDQAALTKLRFREGDALIVREGPHAGKRGIVERLLLRHLHAYLIRPDDGTPFQASDAQVAPAAPSS
jgi:hypothetical protein